MRHLACLALLLLAAAPIACVAGAPDALGPGDMPAPLPEIRSAPPNPAMVWVPGSWHRDGPSLVWLPGHWSAPPPVP
ncbi:MAG: YXWGXW repeat-containing protein [Byssovorax sp.]